LHVLYTIMKDNVLKAVMYICRLYYTITIILYTMYYSDPDKLGSPFVTDIRTGKGPSFVIQWQKPEKGKQKNTC